MCSDTRVTLFVPECGLSLRRSPLAAAVWKKQKEQHGMFSSCRKRTLNRFPLSPPFPGAESQSESGVQRPQATVTCYWVPPFSAPHPHPVQGLQVPATQQGIQRGLLPLASAPMPTFRLQALPGDQDGLCRPAHCGGPAGPSLSHCSPRVHPGQRMGPCWGRVPVWDHPEDGVCSRVRVSPGFAEATCRE